MALEAPYAAMGPWAEEPWPMNPSEPAADETTTNLGATERLSSGSAAWNRRTGAHTLTVTWSSRSASRMLATGTYECDTAAFAITTSIRLMLCGGLWMVAIAAEVSSEGELGPSGDESRSWFRDSSGMTISLLPVPRGSSAAHWVEAASRTLPITVV